MKKVFALFVGLFLLPLTVHATDFKEGKHYTVVSQVATAQPEVSEFFSFYCPHCYKFEPLIKNIQKELPESVKVKKNHVNFLGKDMGPKLTHAYAAAQLLGKEDEVASIIFQQIHVKNKRYYKDEDILAVFVQAGISEADAKSALAANNFSTNGIASQMKRNTENFKIRGVPTLIINGKYQVKTGSVKSEKEFIELVKFLTTKN